MGVPEIIKEPKHSVRGLFRIAHSSLPKSLKKKVLRTKLLLCARSHTGKNQSEVECPLLDGRFTAYSIGAIKALFDEIFVGQMYFFATDKPRPFILDCGSNIGMSIFFFKALYPGSAIIGFEPAVDSFALLRKNVQSNKLGDVTIHPFAVGQTASQVSFYRNGGAGSFGASTNPQRISARQPTEYVVEQVRLSSFIDREVDFLKLDVEGAETGVIAELRASGKIRNIVQMVIEYHHHIDKKKDDFSLLLAQLEQAGFGYQLGASLPRKRIREHFQDILVYAYRKD